MSAAGEIPLLSMSFYLFRDVGAVLLVGIVSGIKLSVLCAHGDLRGRHSQMGSLAGAAHLLNNNTGVPRSAQ